MKETLCTEEIEDYEGGVYLCGKPFATCFHNPAVKEAYSKKFGVQSFEGGSFNRLT